MKILLYSYVFSPNLGGIETVSLRLAESWIRQGHEVTVVTETPGGEGLTYPYPVVRRPRRRERLWLARAHDIVYSNGPSVRFAPFAWLAGKPFCWTLVAYQIQCIDGMGVVDGQPAPRTPWASFLYHGRRFGWPRAIKGGMAMLGRKLVARLASANIDITHFMAHSHPVPRQLVIYNPTYVEDFHIGSEDAAWARVEQADSTFFFMGRVSSEKGVETLLRAFALVCQWSQTEPGNGPSLKIIGDGSDRVRLQKLCLELKINDQVRWTGALPQKDYVEAVRNGGICVLPSVTPEPMGVVVLEAMAAGKPLIVSGPSGLSECTGDAALRVPLWDVQALASEMLRLCRDKCLQRELSRLALKQVVRFDPEQAGALYASTFQAIVRKECLPMGDEERGDFIARDGARADKILLYSYAFYPSVGGVETASRLLALGLVRAGRQVTVITETLLEGHAELEEGYQILRQPDLNERWNCVRAHDVVHSNGASVRLFYLTRLARRPFSWTHTAHQIQCLDGLGVVDAEISPIEPWPSVFYHIRKFGVLAGLRGGLILWNRRWIAQQVEANVEITHFMAQRHDIPRKKVIYNPFDVDQFLVADPETAVRQVHEHRTRFLYLGRLSSEKGIDVLFRAFARLVSRVESPLSESLRLRIVGEGPYRQVLEKLAMTLGIADKIEWRGTKTGIALLEEIKTCGIAVAPSITPEPLGIVVLELMTAGRPMIVSADTGLSECAGSAGFAVPRGDDQKLAEVMELLLTDERTREEAVRNSLRRSRQFDPEFSVRQYAALFDVIKARRRR